MIAGKVARTHHFQ